ncbi:hypothetical protein G6F22_019818 [Rhizopus arrhizus]|nr:hypothetical protein G6F22_019818 [Rhizopus arrhizus]
MALQRQFNQPRDQRGVVHAAGTPQLRVHADAGEARQRVDLVDDDLAVCGEEHIHARHAGTLQRLVGLQRDVLDARLGGSVDA